MKEYSDCYPKLQPTFYQVAVSITRITDPESKRRIYHTVQELHIFLAPRGASPGTMNRGCRRGYLLKGYP